MSDQHPNGARPMPGDAVGANVARIGET